MDIQRILLFAVFAFSGLYLWESWQADQRLKHPPLAAQSTASQQAGGVAADVPGVPTAPGEATLPATSVSASPTASVPETVNDNGSSNIVSELPAVKITTDLYTAEINPVGGVITQMALLKQPDALDKTKPYYVLQKNSERTFMAQAGLTGDGMPNHRTTYEVLSTQRELKDGEKSFDLRLATTAANGDRVEQILTFHRDSYVIDVTFKIIGTATAVAPHAYFQFARDTKISSKRSAMAPASYIGPVVFNEADKFTKVNFDDLDKLAADPLRKPPFTSGNNNGWVAMIEHYFVTAWALPDSNTTQREFYARKIGDGLYSAGMLLPMRSLAPEAGSEVTVPMYAGPQDQDTLKALAKDLNRVVDYGMFTVIAAPMFWLLNFFHNLIGNWGWSIIAMTFLIRIVFYPLNAAAARSMGKMRVVAPRLKALQEQYKDDKQQMQMKMMEMYRQEKINPLGGCLPILVQMPFFIALYWVLLSAAELRYAPWFGWITDLSSPDPWYLLPVLYAASAFLQMRLSPMPISDPMQARMMQMMPIAFSILFIFFPSGLVLYWLVSNVLQIAQQWHMNRMLEREAAAKT
ncbi:MAG: membrane protein insertase YidC [Burkholderiales bacterium]|jgi:YidC/Oxa1 family membrane protein insertase|nr:membrane protein insertase YidC [Burkholderiales bacterium]